ncbi:MAG: hypothetical protein AB1752_03590, partial [Candidatus Zixiibacteriota bacterium]
MDSTTHLAYDSFGNGRLELRADGVKFATLWGYSGTKPVLAGPDADTGEVSYNGFEDGLAFDGWDPQGSILTNGRAYTGMYSGMVIAQANPYGVERSFTDGALQSNRSYVFSAWVYTTGVARLRVGVLGIGDWPDTSVFTTVSNRWQRLEIIPDIPQGTTGLVFGVIGVSDTTYFDDLRVHPVDSPTRTFAYDRASMQLVAEFDANNLAAERYDYDGFGRLTRIRNPGDTVIARFEYYYSREATGQFDPDNPNHVKEIRYRSISDSSVTMTFSDGLGREIQRQTAVNNTLRVVEATFYNPAGQVWAKTKPIEVSGPIGSMAFITDLVPEGWTPGDTLTSGRLHAYYDSDGPGPDCHGFPYTQFTYSQDPLRRLKETAFPDTTWATGSGRTVRIDYLVNQAGDVAGWDPGTLTKTKTTDEAGQVSYEYRDRLDRVVQLEVDSAGTRFKTRMEYDVLGNMTKSIRQRSASDEDISVFEYDALSRMTIKQTADDGTTRYLYDRTDNLRFVEPSALADSGKFIYYRYDDVGRKIEEGLVNNLSQFTQANANTREFPTTGYTVKFSFTYDSLQVPYGRGRLASWRSGDGAFGREFRYDYMGNVIEERVRLDGITSQLTYFYNLQGEMLAQVDWNSPMGVQPVGWTRDMAGRITAVGQIYNEPRFSGFDYWPSGQVRTHELYADPGFTALCQRLDYRYNPRDWLLTLNDGAVSALTTGNGDHFALRLGYGKSLNGDIDTLRSERSGALEFTEVLTYDLLGRLHRSHRREAIDTTGDLIFTYDRAGNFLTRKKPDDPNSYWYAYHSGTNRLKKMGVGTPDTATHFVWDASGTLRSEPGITYTNDYRRLPTRVTIPKSGYTNTIDFVYDADGRRIKKVYDRGFICQCGPEESPPLTPPDGRAEGLRSPPDREPGALQPLPDSGPPGVIKPGPASAAGEGPGPGEECICRSVTVTHYLYTHDGRLLREYVNGIGQRDFIHAGPASDAGIGGKKIAVYEHGGSFFGKLYYFLTDHLGSTRVIVDSTGAIKSWFDYHPYGTLRASQVTTVDTKHRYTGKEHDGDDILNQDYFGARYLHGNTLRFTAVDPQAA